MKKKRLCLIAGIVLALAVCALLFLPKSEKKSAEVIVHEPNDALTLPTQPSHPALQLVERRENGDMIELVTTYCTLRFPYAFSDLVVQEITDQDGRIAIDFYAALGGERYPVYTVLFSGGGNIPLGTLQVDDVTFEVSANFHEDTANLQGDDMVSFCAAQETFNDIWASLEANENFTSAQ